MAPKRDLDALEDGEFSFTADHIVTKRSKFGDSSSSNEGEDSYLYIVGDSSIHQSSAKPQIATEPQSSTKVQSKKRNFDEVDDEDNFNFNDIHVVSKKFKSLTSYQGKEIVPLNAEAESNSLWCTQIANELTEYIPTNLEESADSSSSTCSDDEASTPNHEPSSDDTCIDEDMMDVGYVTLGTYDPTKGIYDAVLGPKTKDGTLEVMRQRTLDIIQILNNPERFKKYRSLWLRSLLQILHAAIIAAERSLISWQLTPVEVEDLHKIAAVMENIAMVMPDWNKSNFPSRLLRNVDLRFRRGLQVSCLLVKVISHFEIDCHMDTTDSAETFEVATPVYNRDGFFDPQSDVEETFNFWRNDGSDLQLGNMDDMFHFRML